MPRSHEDDPSPVTPDPLSKAGPCRGSLYTDRQPGARQAIVR
ncbi:MAG: hypothetical protein ACLPN6_22480 [Streptosporangiaceae bacterium]